MYKAVEKSVLLYGSESWMVTGEMLKVLAGFNHREARQITGMTKKRVADGEYPPVVVTPEAAGLNPIQEYIWGRQVTIPAQMACCPIYELCTKAERRPGKIRMIIWWDQDVVHESEE